MERIILKSNAHQKPSILIPFINLAANKIISALITKRKSPNVTTVMGSVRKTNIGFITAFKQANTNAKIIAVPKSEIWTPDKILDKTYAMMPDIKSRKMKFIWRLFNELQLLNFKFFIISQI